MGNDIISVLMDRKKSFTVQLSSCFVKYLIDEKAKINKTVEKMVSIYFRDFYFGELKEEEELNRYFSLQNSKDELLKASLLCSIRFYQENQMSENIERDIRTLVLLSNALYLAISLEKLVGRYYDKDENYLDSFFKKYQNKLRFCKEEKIELLHAELASLVKKEEMAYRKFFKLLNDTEYDILLEPLLDYPNGYHVSSFYRIKKLSRYSKTEIKQVYDKKEYYLEESILSLERLSIHWMKKMLEETVEEKYFVNIPVSVFEKDRYYHDLKSICTNPTFKKSLVFKIPYKEFLHHRKIAEQLSLDSFEFALCDIPNNANENVLEDANYLLISSEFLDQHGGSFPNLDGKDIRFILWEGDRV